MMDCASGISDARRKRIVKDPARELLGDPNIDLTVLCDIWDAPDLGEAFRENVVSDVPVLLLHGGWDTSRPESLTTSAFPVTHTRPLTHCPTWTVASTCAVSIPAVQDAKVAGFERAVPTGVLCSIERIVRDAE